VLEQVAVSRAAVSVFRYGLTACQQLKVLVKVHESQDRNSAQHVARAPPTLPNLEPNPSLSPLLSMHNRALDQTD
jgi:hypothetical protein